MHLVHVVCVSIAVFDDEMELLYRLNAFRFSENKSIN